MKKVKTGEKLAISASTWNTFIDVARDYQQRRQNTLRQAQGKQADSGVVLVKNASIYNIGRFYAMGIDGPVITPADNLDGFKDRVALSCSMPTAAHKGRWVVLAEMLAPGAIGRAWVSGVCPARLSVLNESHEYADVVDASSQPATAESGPAQILWKDAGTGSKWALIRLGNMFQAQAAGSETTVHKIVASLGSAAYTLRRQKPSGDTDWVDDAAYADVTACNLPEISLGTGSGADDGTLVIAFAVGGRWVFSHPVYAKYLD